MSTADKDRFTILDGAFVALRNRGCVRGATDAAIEDCLRCSSILRLTPNDESVGFSTGAGG